MPTSIKWHEHHPGVLILEFEGQWTIEEFWLIADEARPILGSYYEQHGDKAALIIDVLNAGEIPRGANMILHFKKALGTAAKYASVLVIVGSGAFGITLLKTVVNLLPIQHRRIMFANSMNEAITEIEGLKNHSAK